MKVKIGDRVVATAHSGPQGPGVVDQIEFAQDGWTGAPRPPYVWVQLDRGGRQVFRMLDVEKEAKP